MKSIYKKRFPHRADVPRPPRGLGKRLNEMHQWCHARFGGQGGEGRPRAVYSATFYFLNEADAAAFSDEEPCRPASAPRQP